ncbi:MAG: hypothetical protein K9N55_08750 [Phycisphaerae bacterium]|nr:hypothetical protein [Phycisphaerae bacterium]
MKHTDPGIVIPLDAIRAVTLVRVTRETQEQGATSQRWPGDTSGQSRYVEAETWTVQLKDFPDGQIPLEPGMYQFKHNSVAGHPPSGFYGNSDFFEIKVGQAIVVEMTLNAAI